MSPPPSALGGVLTTASADGTLAAVYVPTPATTTGGASMVRHSIKLYDTAVSHRLQSTLVASVESADGPLVQLALEQPARMLGDDGGGGPPPPPRYLAARLSSSSDATSGAATGRPDKILVWDLARGVVGCTLEAPGPALAFRGLAVRGATLYALAVHGETGRVHVMEHDLAPEGGGRPTRRVKCPGLGAGGAAAAQLGLAVAGCSAGGGKEENVLLAVRLGGTLRIIDGATGKKLAKCKVRGDDDDNDRSGSNGGATPVLFSSDAALVATTTASGLQIFRASEGGRPLGTVAGRGGQQPVGDAALRPIGGGRYAVLTTEPAGGCAYLSEFGGGGAGGAGGGAGGKKGGNKGGNIAPLSTIQCADAERGVVAAAFHGASPGSRVVVVAMPGTGNNSVAAAVGSRGNVEIDEVDYRDEDGNMVRGDIVVGDADDMEEDMDDADGMDDAAATGGGGAKKTKKKKRALPSGELVLGPGEAGGEALGVTDRATSTSKRAKVVGGGGGGDDDDDDADDGDEFVLPDDDATEEAAGATIADRLALLTSEMERDADEDSDDDGGSEEDEEAVAALYGSVAGGKGGKTKGRATSESLSTLLRQALSSNDDGQLEVALHVHDKKVIEHSIATLAREDEEADDGRDDDMITKLLGKLVDRLGRKPGRAEELSIWVQTVLLLLISGKSMSRREREVAAKLAPLRSMLNERVESLPHLLRLEGRLSLLGQQL